MTPRTYQMLNNRPNHYKGLKTTHGKGTYTLSICVCVQEGEGDKSECRCEHEKTKRDQREKTHNCERKEVMLSVEKLNKTAK